MESDDKLKYQYGGLKWLYEMELVDDPQLINNLKLNILTRSRHIREVEFITIYESRQMLIWLDLSWFGRTFFAKHICSEVHEIVQQLLPKFRMRVTNDKAILELAQERLKNALKGGQNESSNTESNSDSSDESSGEGEL